MSVTSVHRPHISVGTHPTVGQVARHATYATTLAGVYTSVGFLFYYAAKEKLLGAGAGTMPAPLRKEFTGSFFASVPGDNASWILLGIIEAAVVVLLALSLLRGEFLATREKPFLLAGIGTSMLALAVMALANNMVGDHATALEVSTYFGVSTLILFLIRQMPPYRSMDWLAGKSEK
jgi:hypothetical protein